MTQEAPKTALVTGASQGIGRAAVKRLTADGWSVLALARNQDALSDLSRETGCAVAPVDLAEAGAIKQFCDAQLAAGTRFGAIVNNAAVMGGAPMGQQTLAEWERFMAINVTAPWALVSGLLTALVPGASIINVGSVASVTGFANRTAYCASKHALAGLTKAMAAELAPKGIRANLLVLGTFETPGLSELAGDRLSEFAARQLLNRLGAPDEAADAIAFLASSASSFMTGSSMTVDGGMLIKGATT